MTINPLNKLYLSIRQDVLPIGMAVAKRTWCNGVKDIIQVFNKLESPVDQLRQEGDGAAQLVCSKLNNILSEVGSSIGKAEVSEDEEGNDIPVLSFKMKELLVILTQIDHDLDLLSKYLENL
ncbi:hypothetical protein PMYN1_Chma382 (chromatophore) [Paulinella micropora]|uniref:Uncharacterized protein n=1 Tax=Paulinella micropora TaxID=1928728 RepID=A0A1L5YBY4_9EUKA|nr:hypothetical protein PCKR_425 [Paulinella micropora]AQX44977.1 hypothetical protein PFK_425 [Paulinella micropora]BBL86191.1 hypothetical protein PMYN1_Chma382 [Paulinella micropora]